MFKKATAVLLTLALVGSLCACGQNSTSTDTTSAPVAASSSEADSLAQDEAELAAIGDVEVSNGILTVSVTMPSDFVDEDTTQEALDQGAGESYVSAKLNDDGSVTYKLTKAQYHKMLDGIKEGIDSGIKELVDSTDYNISAVEHNDDYTVFDVTMDGTELGLYDSFAAIGFYMYGGMYGIFSGHPAQDITVNYRDIDGNIIETGNSSELANSASSTN